ncbi:MAG: ribosomal L7Ae/L30e/S12e/Gadd45 family protein [Lachnospiraceae bacterium]|nr:ribosomal L7Ae/L30e/S12e/Gadd45 family protein [Lachnospiraceae bacterium]
MNQDRVLSSLSLCKKAGLLACGELQVEEAVKSGKGQLVILAADAGGRVKKDVTDMCNCYQVEIREYGTRDSLGQVTGKGYLSQVCVTDKKFSESITQKMEVSNGKNEDS